MKLPNGGAAVVSEAKVRDYLLSTAHPVGRFKARFFRGLGYTPEQWVRLQQDLLELARIGEAVLGQKNAYGQKYEVRGILISPAAREADVTTIWIILSGETDPQLITAFPGG